MSIEVRHFLPAFFDESLEAVRAMQTGLRDARLEPLLHSARRLATASAAFGMPRVREVTRLIESLVRHTDAGGAMGIERRALLTSSLDCLADMLLAAQGERPMDARRIEAQVRRLQEALAPLAPAADGVRPAVRAGV